MVITSLKDILTKFNLFSKVFVIAVIINLFLIVNVLSASSASKISKKTGLPLPRFVSLKSNKVNLRRGPSLDYKIDWVYKRKHLPLMIVLSLIHI